MMNTHTQNSPITGLSLLCDPQGRIVQFLRDDLTIGKKVKTGQIFTDLFDETNVDKAFRFLIELRSKGMAFDWSLTLSINQEPTLLHFSGGMSEQQLFIVGTFSAVESKPFFSGELKKINNAQASTLREMMKEWLQSNTRAESDSQLYEQFSQLNNELANTQRELAKKNALLVQQKKELKTLNQQLSLTINELEQTRDTLIQSEKMASLGRLVSGFAHEINTPIGIAITAASTLEGAGQSLDFMLSQEEVSENDLLELLKTIAEAGKMTLANVLRAADLVRSFKRTSLDQSEETKRLFKLSEVIKDVILSLQSQFKKTAISIEIHHSTEFNLYGYPGAISQILTNLLINSYIHGFENGQQGGKITIDAHQENSGIFLHYRDTGKGMSEETRQKIFEPFYTTRRAKGCTGLGLYVCYNIITNQLKGNISCQSIMNQGSEFHINFPQDKLDNLS